MTPSLEFLVASGFGFFLLGVAALIQPSDPRRIPLSRHFAFLSSFGFLHAASTLLNVWMLRGRGTNGSMAPLVGLFLLLSYLSLLEFARRGTLDVMRPNGFTRVLRRWEAPYAGVLLALASYWTVVGFTAQTISAGAHFFVGIPAAILTAFVFSRGIMRPARIPLGFSFVALGVLGGQAGGGTLTLPGEAQPGHVLAAVVDNPAQVLLAICALVAAGVLIYAVRSTAHNTMTAAIENEKEVANFVGELERRVAERTRSLAKSERDLKEALETVELAKQAGKIGTWSADIRTGKVTSDALNLELHGLPPELAVGTWEDWSSTVHPDDVERVKQEYRDALANKSDYFLEYRIVNSSGELRHLKGNALVIRDDDGKPVRVVGMNYDLTPIREKEEELLRAQKVASQAQKMETIGQLTGGVAHDFNNLLAVILGNLELIRETDDPAKNARFVEAAITAANRGAELTKNMLSFARKSRLEPEVIDLNAIVRETKSWSSRVLPAQIDVEVSLLAGLWPTLADATLTQNALLNLILNARDAMPEGGKLTIETSNLRIDEDYIELRGEDIAPGRYVMLAVSDTGTGIARENLGRIFEPFFTTKPTGTGSGLGLSMIQGFMKQSGGTVRVYSEVGVGTTFKLYFRAMDSAEYVAPPAVSETEPAPCTGASILAVEDEPAVLDVLIENLSRAGYNVTAARSGDEALRLWEKAGPFDLLITDIVMPGALQGTGLARHLRTRHPDLPVVFMSGYASEATVHGNGLRPEDIRLMKPVRRVELIAAIEKALYLAGENASL